MFTLLLFIFGCNQQQQPETKPGTATDASAEASTFKGDIKLDVRDSKADWAPYIRKKAPEGSPNVLFVLYDDTGFDYRARLDDIDSDTWTFGVSYRF